MFSSTALHVAVRSPPGINIFPTGSCYGSWLFVYVTCPFRAMAERLATAQRIAGLNRKKKLNGLDGLFVFVSLNVTKTSWF